MTLKILSTIMLLFTSITLYAADFKLTIRGIDAKNLYHYLTAKSVQNEGAMGHLYREGKNITCNYVEVDMNDAHGKALALQDPGRFTCIVYFNREGAASSASS